MDIPSECFVIETRLAKVGAELDDFFAAARINRTTWGRWKGSKRSPRLAVWRRVEAAVEAFERGRVAA